ncbi:MAG: stage II sporulation protein R [Lachnospiraceae bacterium]|nr:stage II sporulation protein R [Lachnospiraceae bacterium]
MAFRIIRGALVGTILGLLIGVGLSGAMYMFNYMRAGIQGSNQENMIAQDTNLDTGEEYVATLNTGISISREYDCSQVSKTLKEQGIAGLAKDVASGFGVKDTTNLPVDVEESKEDILGENLIRFHVRANSNSDVDIALKYKVRDGVLAALQEGLSQCETRSEAMEYITDNLDSVKDISEEILSKQGYNYSVEAYMTNDYFPMRQYGEMVLPAGNYQALRIDIGLAGGENFWCLLYPTMCFPMEAGGVITKEGQQELEEALTAEQYDKLFVKKEIPKEDIEIRFKLFELIFG